MSEIRSNSEFEQAGQMDRGAIGALAAAQAAGITLTRNGDKILLEALDLPEDIVAGLIANKLGLLRIFGGPQSRLRRRQRRTASGLLASALGRGPTWHAALVAEGWGDQAILLGWTIEELYSVPPLWRRVDLIGAALLIDDRRVATEFSIAVVTPQGSLLRFRRAGREHID
jgi:hypothetical protein